MPYISPETRAPLSPVVAAAKHSGELNFQLTKVVVAYLNSHGLSYQTCNDIVGALDNAKDEFRRRIQHPYEDTKIAANGDVY
jgi:hypothetical protein